MPGLTERERLELLKSSRGPKPPYPRDKSVHELFSEQAKKTADAKAVVCEESFLTYEDLERRSDLLASYLRDCGVKCETPVAISIDRSCEMVVALLAILKSGGAYVPLDPRYPEQRLQLLLQDTEVPLLITQRSYSELFHGFSGKTLFVDADLWEELPQEASNSLDLNGGDALAYVMYTSGSTGDPKGVSIVHRGIVRLVKNSTYCRVTEQDVFLQYAPLTFDASTFEIWMPLLNGAQLVLAPPGPLSLKQLTDCVQRYGVTTLWVTAGLFHQLVDYQLEGLRGVRQVLSGGDVLSPSHVRKALAALPGCSITNGYGPTENTTFTSCHTVRRTDDLDDRVPIGQPIAQTDAYVLDEDQQLVPNGTSGELYVGGDGLARGYWRQPVLTNQRFVNVTLGPNLTERLYRTGDRVYRTASGNLEFLGRIDQQMKVRGFRIEPGEIETALREHTLVEQAIVLSRERSFGDKELVAYVVCESSNVLSQNKLRGFLLEILPTHMIPNRFVLLPELPITGNGKVDRGALREITVTKEFSVHQAPKTTLHKELCELWESVLETSPVGINETFVDLGGDSLRAMQLLVRIQQRYQVSLSVSDLIPQGTIQSQSEVIEKLQRIDSSPMPGAPTTGFRAQGLPLSKQQQRLWFLHKLYPESRAYTIVHGYRLYGSLDADLLERCFQEVVTRHGVLRSTFQEVEGQPFVVIRNEDFVLERIDLSTVPVQGRDTEINRRLKGACAISLDLNHDPLLQATLLAIDAKEHVLVLLVHHMVFDGWSEQLLFQEVGTLYSAWKAKQPYPLAPLPFQYSDYASWQQQFSLDLSAERTYWKTRLRGAPNLLKLPTDFPRPAQITDAGGTIFRSLPKSFSDSLEQASQMQSTTPFAILLAAFARILQECTGQNDLIVGTAVAHRDRQDLESLIGLFPNTVALRIDASGSPTLTDLLKRVEQTITGALDHCRLPFEEVVRELNIERNASFPPLVQVVLNFHTADVALPGLRVERLPVDTGTAKFDCTMQVVRSQEGLDFWLEYRSDLFKRETMHRFAGRFQDVLQDVVNSSCGIAIKHQRVSEGRSQQEYQEHEIKTFSDSLIGVSSPDLYLSLAKIWRSLLKTDQVQAQDDFFTLGGHSLLALELAVLIKKRLGLEVPMALLYKHKTLAQQAGMLSDVSKVSHQSQLITLCEGTGPPLILMPGLGGHAFSRFDFIRLLSRGIPILTVDLSDQLDSDKSDCAVTIESLAAACIERLHSVDIREPYRLLGYSFGGLLAYEVASQLERLGEKPSFLGLIDVCPNVARIRGLKDVFHFANNVPRWFANKMKQSSILEILSKRLESVRQKSNLQDGAYSSNISMVLDQGVPAYVKQYAQSASGIEHRHLLFLNAYSHYRPSRYSGRLVLFRARERPLLHHFAPDAGWSGASAGKVTIREIPGDHEAIMKDPNSRVLADEIWSALEDSQRAINRESQSHDK